MVSNDLMVAFLVFSQHPAWFYYASKALESAVYCLNNEVQLTNYSVPNSSNIS